MKIYPACFTPLEREHLASLATALRSVATHELTQHLAAILDQWASAPVGHELDTATLDQSAEQVTAAWNKMRGAEQQAHWAEFYAASECRYAARGAGMRAPQSFSENVADAARALSAAQR